MVVETRTIVTMGALLVIGWAHVFLEPPVATTAASTPEAPSSASLLSTNKRISSLEARLSHDEMTIKAQTEVLKADDVMLNDLLKFDQTISKENSNNGITSN